MKKIAFAVLAVVAFSVHASAPNVAPPKLDPQTTRVVGELLAAMNYPTALSVAHQKILKSPWFPQKLKSEAASTIEANPKLNDAQRRTALSSLDKTVARGIESMGRVGSDPAVVAELVAELGALYARQFTLDEMRQLTALYKTPLGAKLLDKSPTLYIESAAITAKVIMPRLNLIMQNLATGESPAK